MIPIPSIAYHVVSLFGTSSVQTSKTLYLPLEDGHRLAFNKIEGSKLPGVIFLPGFRSNKNGQKAKSLERWCRQVDRPFVRFDYRGHGESSGVDQFSDFSVDDWIKDARCVIETYFEEPPIIVASSMGVWIAMKIAMTQVEIPGIVGLASAPNFTEFFLTPTQRESLRRDGFVRMTSSYETCPYIISEKLILKSKQVLLWPSPEQNELNVQCPVRLMHGLGDKDIPWQRSVELAERIQSPDVCLTLVKDGDHRLSREEDIKWMTDSVEEICSSCANRRVVL